jgi:hypothetical protein
LGRGGGVIDLYIDAINSTPHKPQPTTTCISIHLKYFKISSFPPLKCGASAATAPTHHLGGERVGVGYFMTEGKGFERVVVENIPMALSSPSQINQYHNTNNLKISSHQICKADECSYKTIPSQVRMVKFPNRKMGQC